MSSQTDLELAAGRKAIDRYSTSPAPPTRNSKSTPVDTGIIAGVTAMQARAHDIKSDMASQPPDASTDQVKSDASLQVGGGALKAAEKYIGANWHVFPGILREKTPKTGWSWTKNKLNLADAPKYFAADQHNVLVALGKTSNDVVDIDLDWPEAGAAAD